MNPRLAQLKAKLLAWPKYITEHMTGREKAAMTALLIIVGITGALSVSGFVGRHTELLPQAGGSYTEAAVGQPRYLNPILAQANDVDLDISRLIHSSLFKLDKDLKLVNDLAASVEISPDQKKYIVALRPGVVWHDGEAFTADDVVFTIRSIQTPDFSSPLITSFQGVEVSKVDDLTVAFTLEQPYALFLNSLTVGIMPQHVWEEIPPKNATLAEQILKPVGTGPFRFVEITSRRKTGDVTSIHLAKNEQYYGQAPYLEEITFVFYPSHEEALQALLASRVEGISFLPLRLAEEVRSRASLMVHRLRIPQYFALFFNQNKNEVLRDAGVRAALALAVDREALVANALQAEGEVLQLPIPPDTFAFHDKLKLPTFDPEVAKQNLEDAGWKDTDGDGVREKDGKRLELKLITTDWPEFVATAELVKEMWQAIGVATTIESFGPGTIQQTAVRPRDYEVLLFGEILPAQPDPYPFWHSTQTRSPGLNLALFQDKDVDKLLEEARRTNDEAVRYEKYLEFQEKILDLNPAIILYRPYYLFAQKNKVRGVADTNVDLPAGRFANIEQWHVKTKRVWKSQ